MLKEVLAKLSIGCFDHAVTFGLRGFADVVEKQAEEIVGLFSEGRIADRSIVLCKKNGQLFAFGRWFFFF